VTKPTHNTPNLIVDDNQQTPFYDQLVSGTTKINSTKAIQVLMAGYVLMRFITRDQPIIEASFSRLIAVAPAFGQGAYGSANASV
jgi:hypothetical protein|tara:strand:+ start:215 stop:469 length:255 start_codon:yes stop_codon:yes gene_type:complete